MTPTSRPRERTSTRSCKEAPASRAEAFKVAEKCCFCIVHLATSSRIIAEFVLRISDVCVYRVRPKQEHQRRSCPSLALTSCCVAQSTQGLSASFLSGCKHRLCRVRPLTRARELALDNCATKVPKRSTFHGVRTPRRGASPRTSRCVRAGRGATSARAFRRDIHSDTRTQLVALWGCLSMAHRVSCLTV